MNTNHPITERQVSARMINTAICAGSALSLALLIASWVL